MNYIENINTMVNLANIQCMNISNIIDNELFLNEYIASIEKMQQAFNILLQQYEKNSTIDIPNLWIICNKQFEITKIIDQKHTQLYDAALLNFKFILSIVSTNINKPPTKNSSIIIPDVKDNIVTINNSMIRTYVDNKILCIRNNTKIEMMLVAPNGKFIVIASSHNILILDPTTNINLNIFHNYAKLIVISPDSTKIAFYNGINVVCVYNINGGKICELDNMENIIKISISPDNERIVCVNDTSNICIYNMQVKVKSYMNLIGSQRFIDIFFRINGNICVLYYYTHSYGIDICTFENYQNTILKTILTGNNFVQKSDFLTWIRDNRIILYNIFTKYETEIIIPNLRRYYIFNTTICTIDTNNKATIMDIYSEEIKQEIQLEDHELACYYRA